MLPQPFLYFICNRILLSDVIIIHCHRHGGSAPPFLSQEHMRPIVDIQLSQLRELLTEKRITLNVDEDVMDMVASEGYDPRYGARPLKRVVQRKLLNPFSVEILDRKIRDGDHVRVKVAQNGKDLEFEITDFDQDKESVDKQLEESSERQLGEKNDEADERKQQQT